MVDEALPDPDGQIARPPELLDLIKLCGILNTLGAQYIVVGGLAINAAGFSRTTEDVDLLIEASPGNEAIVFKALESLPDQAVKELKPGEVAEFIVVRVADDIVIDLMARASGIEYAEAFKETVIHEIEGVQIPFASPELLWRMKSRTHREKDLFDLQFLRGWFAERGRTPPD